MGIGEAGIGTLRRRYPRLLFLPAGIAGGGFMAAGFLRNGEEALAVFGLVVMTIFGAFCAFSKSEYVVAGTGEGDERQKMLALHASRFAYMATGFVALGGALWESYAGRLDGPASNAFSMICFVSAASYAVAFLYLRRRR